MDAKVKKHNYWESDVFTGPYQMDSRPSRMEVLDLIKSLNPSGVLDVGCGTGPFTKLFIDNKIDIPIKGVDYSKRMIKIAKEQFPDADFGVQDATHLNEERLSWDLLLYFHSLDHIGDWKKALRESYRVSRKHVIIVVWKEFVPSTITNANGFFRDELGEDKYVDTYLHKFSKDEIATEIVRCGYSIKSGKVFPDPGKVWNYIYLLEK